MSSNSAGPAAAPPGARDDIVDRLVAFTGGLDPDQLDGVLADAGRRVIDSVGCMLGGSFGAPAQIARKRAAGAQGFPAASVLGLEQQSSLEMATFANAVMLRYLDFNDTTYTRHGRGGHFSEGIPALFAIGEAFHVSGRRFLAAIAGAYEMAAALTDMEQSANGASSGWDYSLWLAVSTSLAGGWLMGLSKEQLRHACAIAAVANVSVWASRRGQISMWKACASAEATRNGVFAALLAAEGMTGPDMPFHGRHGLIEQLGLQPSRFELEADASRSWAVSESWIKLFPCVNHIQGAVELIIGLRDRVDSSQVKEIRVDSFWPGYPEDGAQTPKEHWRPTTRESADHSPPYLLAVSLLDGALTADSFKSHDFTDPQILRLMDSVFVRCDRELYAAFPAETRSRVTIVLLDGEEVVSEAPFPYGHHRNAPSEPDITAKFLELGQQGGVARVVCEELLGSLYELEHMDDLAEVARLFQSNGRTDQVLRAASTAGERR